MKSSISIGAQENPGLREEGALYPRQTHSNLRASIKAKRKSLLHHTRPVGFYINTLKRFAEVGGHRLEETDDPAASVALTQEECEWALQGNPPPVRCRHEIEALHAHWIVTVTNHEVRVAHAAIAEFDPEI